MQRFFNTDGSGMLTNNSFGFNKVPTIASSAKLYNKAPVVSNPTSSPVYGPVYNPPSNTSSSNSGLASLLGQNNVQSSPGLNQMTDYYAEWESNTNKYINDLMSQAGGDRDFVIKQLKRDHDLALGTDDKARAEFLESVADKLEERIGTIPYDYQVGVTRTNQDLARTEELVARNKSQALSRLAEDEAVWREQFTDDSRQVRTEQQEGLLRRGILQGTRDEAQGLAGEAVGNLEKDLGRTLTAYERAIGRTQEDIDRESGDILFDARRVAGRTLEDLKTSARRGAIGEQDKFSFGKEAAQRAHDAKKKELDRLKSDILDFGKASSQRGY